jgi:uncharacterized protein YcfL
MRVKMSIWLAAAITVVLFCGCQNTVNTVRPAEPVMRPQTIEGKKIYTDAFLNSRLKFESIIKSEQPDGLLKVQITAVNVRVGPLDQFWSWFYWDNPYKISYRFTWLDRNGMEVSTPASTWIPVVVIPGDVVRFSAISPNSGCKDFILSVREFVEE